MSHSSSADPAAAKPSGHSEQSSLPDGRRDPIVVLILGTSLLMGSGSVIFTMLPTLQDKVGFPTWGFGLIAGIFFASSLVAQLTLARFADRGHARTLLFAAIGLGVIGLLLMAFGNSLTELAIARGIGGLATGAWAPAARATAIAHKPEQTGRRLSYIAVGDTSGLVIGPLAGSAVAAVFSVSTAFVLFALLILALMPALFTAPIAEVSVRSTSVRIIDLVRRRAILQSVVLGVALFLPVGLYETIWGKHISNLGGTTFIIALSVAFYGLPYMVVAPFGGRLGDRIGPARVALFASGFLVIVTVITGFPRSYWILLPIGVLEAAISAIAYPNALAAVSLAAEDGEQATAQGLAGGASIAGAGCMAMIAGPVFDFAGPVAAFSTAAGLVAVGATIAYFIEPASFSRRAD